MRGLGGLLLLFVAAVLWAPAADAPPLFASSPEHAWAVVIGVSRYQTLPPDKWLEFADADAQAFSKFIASGQGLSFPPDHILQLTNEQATRAEVIRAVGSWLLRRAKQGDSAYIFVAMHGFVEPVYPNDAYLVSYDTSLEDPLTTAVNFREFQDLIQHRLARAARIFVIADACRSGKLTEARPFEDRLAGLKAADVYGLLASGPDQDSREGRAFGGGHGLFTYWLLRGLQGEADGDHNGLVQLGEAASFVRAKVADASNEEQRPVKFGPAADVSLARVAEQRADLGFTPGQAPMVLASLIVNGPPETRVIVDGVERGVILGAGKIAVERLKPDNHRVMLTTPRGIRVVDEVQVSADPTEIEFNGRSLLVRAARLRGLNLPAHAELARQFSAALAAGRLLDPPGQSALELLDRMKAAGVPGEQSEEAAAQLASALESDGQQVLLAYLRGEAAPLAAADFERGARLFAAAERLSGGRTDLRARQLFCEGRAQLDRGDYAAAIRRLTEAAALEPNAAYAPNALGVAALRQHRYDDALQFFASASQRASRWAYPHFNRAVVYETTGQYSRAEEEYRKAIQLGPRYAYLHYSLGRLYMRLNQPDRAEQELRRALELDLDAAAGHNQLGNFYRGQRREHDAEVEYRRALAFDTGDVPARINLARLYMQQDRAGDAEKELREAAPRSQSPLIHAALGDVYVHLGRGKDAATAYRRAAKLTEDAGNRAALEERARRAESGR